MRSAAVVGTGLIGTSIALVLSLRGVTVYLRDADPSAAWDASALGAGSTDEPEAPVDLAVVAVPPASTGLVVAECQRAGLARHYLDVASVKHGPRQDVRAARCDVSRYLGSHPMAGRERSGPLAARSNLFEGRPWVLTPTSDTDTETLNLALEVVALCGAVPVVMDAPAHDRAVALVSHAPQLVASLMAARLEHAEEGAVRLAGQGLRDVTRIAGSDPAMWVDILSANAGVVADVVDGVAEDLHETVRALRELQSADEEKRLAGAAAVADVLRRGNAGQARIPGKHGAAPVRYETVAVLIGDQPGEMARLFSHAGTAGVNIEDVAIEHSAGQASGLIRLFVKPAMAENLTTALTERGWNVRG